MVVGVKYEACPNQNLPKGILNLLLDQLPGSVECIQTTPGRAKQIYLSVLVIFTRVFISY